MPNYDVSDLTRLIASMIRGLMARHGVKQSEMAESIGVSQSQLSKMVRGVRPIDIDQLDGMCRALGVDLSVVIKEAEETLSAYDSKPNARLIFVDDNIRLAEPFDTTTWGDGGPVVPEYRTGRAGVVPLSDNELRSIDLDELRKSDHALAAGNDESIDAEEDVTP
ncbi:helix-turn-helix transcriptional regulator [Sphingomonas sp. LR61]|uniref:helix-turn-helix domain-containing protein n=1 Tax=Sphingomonas sp. LR61 TaxID=3050234 RepID=UPI002FE24FFB